MSTITIRISHESPGADKACKVFQTPPQGAPVITYIQPGQSAVYEVSDCNELHCVEWDATSKPVQEGE